MLGPFLTYLTVFKARLGLGNLVLQQSGFAHQPDAALIRKIRSILEKTEELRLDDPRSAGIFQYLKDKRLITKEARSTGRYSTYTLLEPAGNMWTAADRRGNPTATVRTYLTDIWLASPDVPSTIGVPTPDNVRETFEFALQLRLLSKSTNTWTAAGQLTSSLRTRYGDVISDTTNPLLLGVEAVSLLRQVIAVDGLLLIELLRTVAGIGTSTFSRDHVAELFPEILERAVKVVRGRKLAPPMLREALTFRQTVQRTVAGRRRSAQRSGGAGAGPGLLEHRVSPRLEWLTDLGYLSKDGLPKNAFEYRTTEALSGLLNDLESQSGEDDWAEEVAVRQWALNPAWGRLRARAATESWPSAVRQAYQLMRRRIGPSPLREVAFAISVISAGNRSFRESTIDLVEFAQSTAGANLSGGRYRRTPENIFLSDSLLDDA
jgi:hypothetical protein